MLTEQDRGAYTPQSDAPLAFDARKASGGGSSSVTLFLSVIVLLIAVAVVLLVYRHGVRHGAQPPQVIGAPVGATKTPPNEAQPADQTAGLQVYKTEVPPPAETASAPTFTAPPEQPQPIPAPKAPAPAPAASVESAPLRPAQQPVAVAPALAKPVKPAAAPEETIADAASASGATQKPPIKLAAATVHPAPLHAPPVKTAPPAKPAAKVKASETPAAPSPAFTPATGGGDVVQIGAFSSQALADKGWRDVGAALPGQLAGKSKTVESVSKNGQTFYRTSVAGFASRPDAARFCEALKAAGKTCFVK